MFMNRFIGGSSIISAKRLKIPYKKIYDYVKEGDSHKHIENHKLNIMALKETNDSIHAIKLTSLYQLDIY